MKVFTIIAILALSSCKIKTDNFISEAPFNIENLKFKDLENLRQQGFTLIPSDMPILEKIVNDSLSVSIKLDGNNKIIREKAWKIRLGKKESIEKFILNNDLYPISPTGELNKENKKEGCFFTVIRYSDYNLFYCEVVEEANINTLRIYYYKPIN